MIPERSKFTVVHVTKFRTVQEIADAYRSGTAVDIMLAATTPGIGRRAVDFASGVAYATGGTLEKVGPGHFRLTPAASPRTRSASGSVPRAPYPSLGRARSTLAG